MQVPLIVDETRLWRIGFWKTPLLSYTLLQYYQVLHYGGGTLMGFN